MAMMHDEPISCPAALADVPVANENRLAVSTEAAPRSGGFPVTGVAEA